MRKSFSLFQSHLDLAHNYWKSIVLPGDSVVDATCGNGHDTLVLASLVLCPQKEGRLIAIDAQPEAIQKTRQLLETNLDSALLDKIDFFSQCHSSFPSQILPSSIKLIVYNLGYLPGSNKVVKTLSHTTVKSLQSALPLICPGGLISLTCYPGHPEGKIEEEAVLQFASTLSPQVWSCCYHQWSNRQQAPSLLLIQKQKQV